MADVIQWGRQDAEVDAEMTLGELHRTIRVRVAVGSKKASLDGKGVRRDSEVLRGAAVVVFGPEDLRLPKAAASERRRAIDRVVFGVFRPYLREALAFDRALKGRNSLLRRGEYSRDLLESHEETLAQTGARMVVRRRALVEAISEKFSAAFSEIHGDKAAGIRYRSDPRVEAAGSEEEIALALREGLRVDRKKDEKRGFTGFGPQTDDLEMLLAGHPAREHGSQGEIRSLVLAWKVAELRYLREANQEMPVLLLDDVASELDEVRRARLFETISAMACQTLITVTEKEHLTQLPGRIDWRVAEGRIEQG